ncbi:flagellar hook-associated protein FlgK [Edaphosphingomonas haloaromaticamans]|uniref:Flagellar hook-associated protein 1 n=1 Tax=Edaphosphingomonas haloaromaticamans TaxID=653954 RepID=A0A1S1HIS7_9SPHN|nr:flagellar hook-associated protein FlgK [Sphingomonas haloaromaticamans]OHT21351.1 Flagellar hook-associated protein 1 [Sphingomonas haloaromaticamans]
MSDLLSIGASGISAYKTALSAISDNVANAETPGFTRRSTAQREQLTALPMTPVYRGNMVFSGTQITAITRAYDQFRDQEARAASAEAGSAEARARWLQTAENALDDGDAGIGARLTAFFNAADALASDPANPMPRQALLSALDAAAGAFRTAAGGLATTATGVAKEAQAHVDAVNGSLAALAKVNLALMRSEPGTAAQASLLDERDRLVDDISGRLDIDASYGADGTATLTLAGNKAAKLLSGVMANPIAVAQAANGTLTLFASVGDGTQSVPLAGGAIGGLIDVAATVADRRASLDAIATDFAATVNGWSAAGRDAAGNPGQPLLAIGATGAASLAIATTDPAAVAAASADGTPNGNLIALQSLRSGGAEDRMAALVAGHAQATAQALTQADVTATRRDAALIARAEVTGIDLDREAAELIRFQQAYNGSARIIQVARETLQAILDLF